MTAIRYVEAPRRQPGESGRAFVERMLAQLGGATAPPPKVEITAKTAKVDKALRPKPEPVPESEVKDCVTGPFPVKECSRVAHVVDCWGRVDRRPTTKSWPPGPMGDDGRSTHRYVGPWPPKWASKWTTTTKTKRTQYPAMAAIGTVSVHD